MRVGVRRWTVLLSPRRARLAAPECSAVARTRRFVLTCWLAVVPPCRKLLGGYGRRTLQAQRLVDLARDPQPVQQDRSLRATAMTALFLRILRILLPVPAKRVCHQPNVITRSTQR